MQLVDEARMAAGVLALRTASIQRRLWGIQALKELFDSLTEDLDTQAPPYDSPVLQFSRVSDADAAQYLLHAGLLPLIFDANHFHREIVQRAGVVLRAVYTAASDRCGSGA